MSAWSEFCFLYNFSGMKLNLLCRNPIFFVLEESYTCSPLCVKFAAQQSQLLPTQEWHCQFWGHQLPLPQTHIFSEASPEEWPAWSLRLRVKIVEISWKRMGPWPECEWNMAVFWTDMEGLDFEWKPSEAYLDSQRALLSEATLQS